jgi:hypothetical protein
MKVERVNHGMTHRIAVCHGRGCDWEDAYGGHEARSVEAIARSAKRHALQTGHRVIVESGTSFHYQPTGEGNV